jgi:hypothetical protein
LGVVKDRLMRYLSRLISTFVILAFSMLLIYVLVVETDTGRAGTVAEAPQTATPTMTLPPVFSATVEVVPSVIVLQMSETLLVTVSVSTSEGCQFPIYELTLGQSVPIFEYVSPPTAVVGPPVSNPFTYTLTAVSTGTVTFAALVYGERYCGDYWNWMYLRGGSEPVMVWLEKHQTYLPLILKR